MSVLVDTCIWSAAIRRKRGGKKNPTTQELQKLITDHLVRMIGPIRQELLSGIREPSQFHRLERQLSAFSDEPIITDDYIAAASFYNICRAQGIQASNTDYLICAVADRCGFSIFTTDRDFSRLAKHIPLSLHNSVA